jgi:hypothetical protein
MAEERADSQSLEETAPSPVRVQLTLYPNCTTMPLVGDRSIWSAERVSLFVCGPGRVAQTCGALGDFSLQSPVTLEQLRCLSEYLDKHVPDSNGRGGRLLSLTVNYVGCPACALCACVRLAPVTLVLLCDPLSCAERHYRPGRRSLGWKPRSVILAPRNLLDPRYSLDRTDVICFLGAFRFFPEAKLSFANFPIRLLDVQPATRSKGGDAYFFVQWCAERLLLQRAGASSELCHPPTQKQAQEAFASIERPVNVLLGRGMNGAPVRRHGPRCACADHGSYLNLADVLSVWLHASPLAGRIVRLAPFSEAAGCGK